MSFEETPLDVTAIQDLLPHRYPFLLVDRVIELEPHKRVLAWKNVTANEPFFNGHFPGHPVMPGVLVVEALAQAGGLLTQLSHRIAAAEKGDLHEPAAKKLYYLVKVDGARFSRMVARVGRTRRHAQATIRNMALYSGIPASTASRTLAAPVRRGESLKWTLRSPPSAWSSQAQAGAGYGSARGALGSTSRSATHGSARRQRCTAPPERTAPPFHGHARSVAIRGQEVHRRERRVVRDRNTSAVRHDQQRHGIGGGITDRNDHWLLHTHVPTMRVGDHCSVSNTPRLPATSAWRPRHHVGLRRHHQFCRPARTRSRNGRRQRRRAAVVWWPRRYGRTRASQRRPQASRFDAETHCRHQARVPRLYLAVLVEEAAASARNSPTAAQTCANCRVPRAGERPLLHWPPRRRYGGAQHP